MANPNLIGLTSALAGTTGLNLSTTSETQVLSNASSSGTVIKINSLYIGNSDSSARTATLTMHSAAALGGTSYNFFPTVSIPATSTNVPVIKDTILYLTENTSLGITAGTANTLSVVVSYETLS